MSAQQNPQRRPAHEATMPSSVLEQVSTNHIKSQLAEIENMHERTQREHSVISGMSMEDMEAAETLNSLHKEFHSPKVQQRPPTHLHTTVVYTDDQPEPLLSLVTSQYPLAGAVINGSLTAYKTTQSFIPGAEWTERNVGLPIAGTVARISGVEGGLRRALQSKRESRGPTGTALPTSDVEKGYADATLSRLDRRGSEVSFAESLPAYNANDRSPPYEQQLALSEDRQPPPGWRQQLMISTSGLGIAMSDESLRSLRYCLSWLRWANGRLGGAIHTLKDLLHQWGQDPASDEQALALLTQSRQEDAAGREAVLSAKISELKTEVLQTLKQVVNIVSTYAGGALPENARNLVHRHLTSLPQRFSIAAASSTNGVAGENGSDATSSANRVMVLAQEGLDMMTQVSRVVNDTLVSAESWCEKLGRRVRSPSGQFQSVLPATEKLEDGDHVMTIEQERENDADVKMEM